VNTIGDTGRREGSTRLPPAIFFAAIATAFCLQLLPMLSLLYSVPLFVVFFRHRRSDFALSVVLACILDIALGFFLLALHRLSAGVSSISSAFAGSLFFILPLLAMLLPDTVRLRYRVALAGLLTAAFWSFYIFSSGSSAVITDMVHEMAREVSAMLVPYIPGGYEGAVLGVTFAPDALYDMMITVLLYSVLPTPVIMFTLCAAIASRVSSRPGKDAARFSLLERFYADPLLFFPLVGGMCAIMAGTIFDSRMLLVVAWNVSLTAGFYFLLQGLGVSFFLIRLIQRKIRFIRFWFFLMFFLVAMNGFLPHIALLLLIVGVLELFVPIRLRFINTDTADPTPGFRQ
jgi:hypothetical protein